MAPTLVFDHCRRRGALYAEFRFSGGSMIIQFVENTCGDAGLGLNCSRRSSLVDFGAANCRTPNLGGENPEINT